MQTVPLALYVLLFSIAALAPSNPEKRGSAEAETPPSVQGETGAVQNMGGDRVDVFVPGDDPGLSTSNDLDPTALPDLNVPEGEPAFDDGFRPLTAGEVRELLVVDDEPEPNDLPALDVPEGEPAFDDDFRPLTAEETRELLEVEDESTDASDPDETALGDPAPGTEPGTGGMRRVDPPSSTLPSSPPEDRSPEPAPASGVREPPRPPSDSDSVLVYLDDNRYGDYYSGLGTRPFEPATALFEDVDLGDDPFAGLDDLPSTEPDAPVVTTPEEAPPTAEELGLGSPRAGIRVLSGDSPDDPAIGGVLLGQPFVVEALIPADEDPGTKSVTATIATAFGEETTVALYWDGAPADNGFYTYRSNEESFGGDSYDLVVDGTIEALDLELDDDVTNTALTITYGGRATSLFVFGDSIGAELALIDDALDMIDNVLQAERVALQTFRDNSVGAADTPLAAALTDWESAIARRQRVVLYAREAFVNYDRPIDKLSYARYFLSSLVTKGAHGAEVVENVDERAILQNLGGVAEGVERELLKSWGGVLDGYLFGVYSTFTHVTLAAPVYTLITGEDEFGRPADRRWAAVELGAAIVLVKLPGAIVEWGAGGFARARIGSLSVPGFGGGGGGVRVAGRPGRLAAETAGGRLPYPTARPVRGLKPSNILVIRGNSSGYTRVATDEYLSRIDEMVIQARRRGVPDGYVDDVIREAANEAGLNDTALVIEQRLEIEGALRSGKILVAPDELAGFSEWATPDQVARVFQFDHEIVSTVIAKAYLHQRAPQTWTADELRIVKGILENRETITNWRRVVAEEAGYDGLSPIVTEGDLRVLSGIRWKPVLEATLGGPPRPRLGAAETTPPQPGGATEPEFTPTTSWDGIGPPPVVPARGNQGFDPVAGWDDVHYVDPLGRPTTLAEVLPLLKQVNPGFGSATGANVNCQFCTDQVWRILRGEGAQVAQRGFGGDVWMSHGEGATASHPIEIPMSRDWHMFDSPEPIVDLFEALPPLSHGRVFGLRPSAPGQAPEGHIFNVWKDIDGNVYFLDGQVGRVVNVGDSFVEYGLLLTDFAGVSVPATPRTLAPTPSAGGGSAPGVAPTGARGRPYGVDPNAETILETSRQVPGAGTGTDGPATEAFVPNASSPTSATQSERLFDHRLVQKAALEVELRNAAQLAGRAPRGGFTHWTAGELARLRELGADPSRYVGLLPEFRGAALRAVRDAVAFHDRPVMSTATDDLVVVKATFEAEGRAQRWSPEELKRLEEIAEDPTRFQGLLRTSLSAAEEEAVKHAAGESATPTSRADVPSRPDSGIRFIDPTADPDALGGPSGRGGDVEVVIKSTGGSTGPVLEMFVVNAGKPLRIQGDGLVLEPVAPRDLDPSELARIAAIEAAASGTQPLEPGDGDGGWQSASLDVVKATLVGYCLQFAREVPTEGQVFRIASRESQDSNAPMRAILVASRRLHEAGALSPDSDPTDYYHSIRQWAIWTDERGLDRDGYAEAFMGHVRKNVEAAGQSWSDAIATTVQELVPNRWNDIERILNDAR